MLGVVRPRYDSRVITVLVPIVLVESAVLNFARAGYSLRDLDMLSFLQNQALQGCILVSSITPLSSSPTRGWGLCHLLHNNLPCALETYVHSKFNPTQTWKLGVRASHVTIECCVLFYGLCFNSPYNPEQCLMKSCCSCYIHNIKV